MPSTDGRPTIIPTRYLGLIEKDRCIPASFRLSPLGRHILGLEYRERQLAIAAQILRHRIFSETLLLCLRRGEMPDRQTLIQMMRQASLYRMEAESTYVRRASTVMSWTN